MGLKPPHLPNESAAAYIRRTTVADGVRVHEMIEPTKEHHITEATWVRLSLARTIVLGGLLVAGTWGLAVQYAAIQRRFDRLDERVAESATKRDVDVNREETAQACFIRASAWLQSADVVVNLPNYQTRGQPWRGRITGLKASQ